jgi:two-component system LytT family sensor kinase
MANFLNRKFWGIRIYEYLAGFLFYFFFSYLYHVTLWVNKLSTEPSVSELFSFKEFMASAGLDYLFKFLFTIPIWWLIFRKLKGVSLRKRLLTHLITLPLFVILCQQFYYAAAEAIGWGHLRSYGQVWDIYIPVLFYTLQFGIFHAYEYYYTNQRHLKQKAALREAALKSELSALKAQLNPHFLYNVFNTISASVPSENELTRELIAKLSDLFRYQLKATKMELVPLKDELGFVRKYLDLEKARFQDRLQVMVDVPEDVMEAMVPPMILQPLVENSVKHGIASLIEGGQISIHIQRIGSNIQFQVADTGVGVKDTTQLFNVGLGLTNTKLRLEKMYGADLIISDNVPRGLKVEFSI